MNIKLNSLYITNYDSDDIIKVKFAEGIRNDKLIQYFLYSNIDKMLMDSENLEELKLKYVYLISDKTIPVGFVRFAAIHNLNILEMHYGVHPYFRNKGYGSKILLEVSDYVLENASKINRIKLNIDKENIHSIKCAQNAGFTEIQSEFPTYFKNFMKGI